MRLIALILTALLANASVAEVHIEPTTLVLNQRFEVGAGSYVYFDFPLHEGANLTVSISVAGGSHNKLNIWLVDLPNIQLLQAGKLFNEAIQRVVARKKAASVARESDARRNANGHISSWLGRW